MNEIWQYPEIVLPVRRNLNIIEDDQLRMSALMEVVHFRRRYYGHIAAFECQSCKDGFKHAASVLHVRDGKIGWLYHSCTHPDHRLEVGHRVLRHCWECGNLISDRDGRLLHDVRTHTTKSGFGIHLCSGECLEKQLADAQ